jgi:hypothetical protein
MLIFPAGSRLIVTLESGAALVANCSVFGQDIDASTQTFSCLGQVQLDSAAGAGPDNQLFLVPAGHTYLVKNLSISNPSSAAISVTVHCLPSGTPSPTASTRISGTITIQPDGLGLYEDCQGWRFFNKNQSLAGTSVVGVGLELLGSAQLTANAPYTETVKFTPRDSLLLFVRVTGVGICTPLQDQRR